MPPHFEVKNSVLPATSCIHLFQTWICIQHRLPCFNAIIFYQLTSHANPLAALECTQLRFRVGVQLLPSSCQSGFTAYLQRYEHKLSADCLLPLPNITGLFQKLFDFFHNITKLPSTLLGLYFIYLIPISLTLTSQLILCSFWQMYPMLSKASFI